MRAAGSGSAVEVAVGALHKPGERAGTFAGRTAKRVQRGQVPCPVDLEDSALIERAAGDGGAVEIAIAAAY